jgi:hypothetical protein
MGQLFDREGLLGHKRPTGMMPISGAFAFHCHYEAERGALALSGPLPEGDLHETPRVHTSTRSIGFCAIWVCISSSSSSKGRAQGALCVERSFLTSAISNFMFRNSGAFLYALPEFAPPTSSSLFVRNLATHAP